MSSPDWTSYVDLTDYDVTATDIFNAAITYAKAALPEWRPDVGQIETTLIEAIATQTANVVAAANRVPGAVTETILKLFDINRDDGVKATATIDITFRDTAGYTVPDETTFLWNAPPGLDPLIFVLDDAVTVAAGSSTAQGTVRAQLVGEAYNEPQAGDALQLLSVTPYISTVSFNTSPTGGEEPETDAVYFNRAVTTLRSYSAALNTAAQIQNYILTNYVGTVYRCTTYNRRRANDRDTQDSEYALHDGYVLVVVGAENSDLTDPSDIPLASADLAAVQVDVVSKVHTSLRLDFAAPEVIPVDVECTFVVLSGYTVSEVSDNITDALEAYLAPNNWDWDQYIRKNELIALIDGTTGVDYISSLTVHEAALGNATFAQSTDTWTLAAHELVVGDRIEFVDGGVSPTGAAGYATSTYYWVVATTTDTFQLSATEGGSVLNGTSDSSGDWEVRKATHVSMSSDDILMHYLGSVPRLGTATLVGS